jgi:DNA-directed RNA polymerase specialized sigma24 family protein
MNQEVLQIWTLQAQRGDQRAADRVAKHLLTKFKPIIDRAARRIGMQESLSAAGLAVVEALRQAREGDSIEAFFFSAYRYHLKSEIRSAARRARLDAAAKILASENTIDQEEQFSILARLENAQLSDRDRQIILARLRGDTFTQLSSQFQISIAAVSAAATRAFKKLENANELA